MGNYWLDKDNEITKFRNVSNLLKKYEEQLGQSPSKRSIINKIFAVEPMGEPAYLVYYINHTHKQNADEFMERLKKEFAKKKESNG